LLEKFNWMNYNYNFGISPAKLCSLRLRQAIK